MKSSLILLALLALWTTFTFGDGQVIQLRGLPQPLDQPIHKKKVIKTTILQEKKPITIRIQKKTQTVETQQRAPSFNAVSKDAKFSSSVTISGGDPDQVQIFIHRLFDFLLEKQTLDGDDAVSLLKAFGVKIPTKLTKYTVIDLTTKNIHDLGVRGCPDASSKFFHTLTIALNQKTKNQNDLLKLLLELALDNQVISLQAGAKLAHDYEVAAQIRGTSMTTKSIQKHVLARPKIKSTFTQDSNVTIVNVIGVDRLPSLINYLLEIAVQKLLLDEIACLTFLETFMIEPSGKFADKKGSGPFTKATLIHLVHKSNPDASKKFLKNITPLIVLTRKNHNRVLIKHLLELLIDNQAIPINLAAQTVAQHGVSVRIQVKQLSKILIQSQSQTTQNLIPIDIQAELLKGLKTTKTQLTPIEIQQEKTQTIKKTKVIIDRIRVKATTPHRDEHQKTFVIAQPNPTKIFVQTLKVTLDTRHRTFFDSIAHYGNSMTKMLIDHKILDEQSVLNLYATFALPVPTDWKFKGPGKPLTVDTIKTLNISGSVQARETFLKSLTLVIQGKFRRVLDVKIGAAGPDKLASFVALLVDLLVDNQMVDVHFAAKMAIGQGMVAPGTVGRYITQTINNLIVHEAEAFPEEDKLSIAKLLIEELVYGGGFSPVCNAKATAAGGPDVTFSLA